MGTQELKCNLKPRKENSDRRKYAAAAASEKNLSITGKTIVLCE